MASMGYCAFENTLPKIMQLVHIVETGGLMQLVYIVETGGPINNTEKKLVGEVYNACLDLAEALNKDNKFCGKENS